MLDEVSQMDDFTIRVDLFRGVCVGLSVNQYIIRCNTGSVQPCNLFGSVSPRAGVC